MKQARETIIKPMINDSLQFKSKNDIKRLAVLFSNQCIEID